MYARPFDGWLGSCPGDYGSTPDDIGQSCSSCPGGCDTGPALHGGAGGASWLDGGGNQYPEGAGAGQIGCSSMGGAMSPDGWLDYRSAGGGGGANNFRAFPMSNGPCGGGGGGGMGSCQGTGPGDLPMPNPANGELVLDPDIYLKAKKFGLIVNFYYNSKADDDDGYGIGRSASVRARVLSSVSGNSVTVMRGDFVARLYTEGVHIGTPITYVAVSGKGVTTTLVYDGTVFNEVFPDGKKFVYQAQVGGGDPVKHELTRVEDADGVRHTYVYGDRKSVV